MMLHSHHWRTTRRARSWLALLLCAMGLQAGSAAALDTRASKVNFTINGTVLDVEDGDTLSLRAIAGERFHIRLSDLDAPEVAHANNPYRERAACRNAPARAAGQLDGEAARAALLRLAPRKSAARAECYTIDRYGRPVCHVFVGNSNLNLAQLRDGWAMLLTRPGWVRDPASADAEQSARAAHRGIWAGQPPQAPEQWRNRCWCRAECNTAKP